MNRRFTHCYQRIILGLLLLSPVWLFAEQSEMGEWERYIRDEYFKGIEMIEGNSVIELNAPYRTEDAALTPISVQANIPQTSALYIDKIYLIVDRNPQPLVGIFDMSPEAGKADLGMRIRIDQYTNVRAVAVLNNGEHHMSTKFVKSQGGCSAPLGADLKKAMEHIGEMKFRIDAEPKNGDAVLGRFMVSHPNITGLQRDIISNLVKPAHYVRTIKISHNDKPVMTAEIGFSVSQDPNFRFFFKPEKKGTIKAEVTDSKGLEWSQTFDVTI